MCLTLSLVPTLICATPLENSRKDSWQPHAIKSVDLALISSFMYFITYKALTLAYDGFVISQHSRSKPKEEIGHKIEAGLYTSLVSLSLALTFHYYARENLKQFLNEKEKS
jgi:hypothetical protein